MRLINEIYIAIFSLINAQYIVFVGINSSISDIKRNEVKMYYCDSLSLGKPQHDTWDNPDGNGTYFPEIENSEVHEKLSLQELAKLVRSLEIKVDKLERYCAIF